jgi:hypothetical protein
MLMRTKHVFVHKNLLEFSLKIACDVSGHGSHPHVDIANIAVDLESGAATIQNDRKAEEHIKLMRMGS